MAEDSPHSHNCAAYSPHNYAMHNDILIYPWSSCWCQCVVTQPKPMWLWDEMGAIFMPVCILVTAPMFEVHQLKVKVYSSPVYDGISKGDSSYYMSVQNPVPLCGDIKVEFFNKTLMMKKVRVPIRMPSVATSWMTSFPSQTQKSRVNSMWWSCGSHSGGVP